MADLGGGGSPLNPSTPGGSKGRKKVGAGDVPGGEKTAEIQGASQVARSSRHGTHETHDPRQVPRDKSTGKMLTGVLVEARSKEGTGEVPPLSDGVKQSGEGNMDRAMVPYKEDNAPEEEGDVVLEFDHEQVVLAQRGDSWLLVVSTQQRNIMHMACFLRFYDLPPAMMTEAFAEKLAGKLGKVIKVDTRFLGYLASRVNFPLNKALVPELPVRMKGGVEMDITVREVIVSAAKPVAARGLNYSGAHKARFLAKANSSQGSVNSKTHSRQPNINSVNDIQVESEVLPAGEEGAAASRNAFLEGTEPAKQNIKIAVAPDISNALAMGFQRVMVGDKWVNINVAARGIGSRERDIEKTKKGKLQISPNVQKSIKALMDSDLAIATTMVQVKVETEEKMEELPAKKLRGETLTSVPKPMTGTQDEARQEQ
ncbi:hypothetical protein EJB05_27865, partial [Eragrostis curvula]